MADTFTVRLGARKADPADNVDVNAHINLNSDVWDLNMGFRICTSTTRPASPWQGMQIYETDTFKTYFYNGTTYQQILSNTGGGSWTSASSWNFTRTGSTSNVMQITNDTATGVGQRIVMAASTDAAQAVQVTGDTVDRFRVYGSGMQEWGPGGSTARDTNLYRASANLLKTDDSFKVDQNLTVTGNLTVGGVGSIVTAYKTVATSRTSTAAITADPDLGIALVAGTYLVEFLLQYSSGATGKMATQWGVPASTTTTVKAATGLDSTVSNTTPAGIMRSGIHVYATSVIYGDRAGAGGLAAEEWGVLTCTGAGALTLNWGQSVSNATATVMAVGSLMRVTRIA